MILGLCFSYWSFIIESQSLSTRQDQRGHWVYSFSFASENPEAQICLPVIDSGRNRCGTKIISWLLGVLFASLHICFCSKKSFSKTSHSNKLMIGLQLPHYRPSLRRATFSPLEQGRECQGTHGASEMLMAKYCNVITKGTFKGIRKQSNLNLIYIIFSSSPYLHPRLFGEPIWILRACLSSTMGAKNWKCPFI